MKVEVTKPFADLYTRQMYEVGIQLDVEAERAAKMVREKYAVAVEPPKKRGKKNAD